MIKKNKGSVIDKIFCLEHIHDDQRSDIEIDSNWFEYKNVFVLPYSTNIDRVQLRELSSLKAFFDFLLDGSSQFKVKVYINNCYFNRRNRKNYRELDKKSLILSDIANAQIVFYDKKLNQSVCEIYGDFYQGCFKISAFQPKLIEKISDAKLVSHYSKILDALRFFIDGLYFLL